MNTTQQQKAIWQKHIRIKMQESSFASRKWLVFHFQAAKGYARVRVETFGVDVHALVYKVRTPVIALVQILNILGVLLTSIRVGNSSQ